MGTSLRSHARIVVVNAKLPQSSVKRVDRDI